MTARAPWAPRVRAVRMPLACARRLGRGSRPVALAAEAAAEREVVARRGGVGGGLAGPVVAVVRVGAAGAHREPAEAIRKPRSGSSLVWTGGDGGASCGAKLDSTEATGLSLPTSSTAAAAAAASSFPLGASAPRGAGACEAAPSPHPRQRPQRCRRRRRRRSQVSPPRGVPGGYAATAVAHAPW